MIGVGQNALSISILRPYGGWIQDFKPRIERALKAYFEVTGQDSVSRVGIRYINKIVVPGAQAKPELYFTNIRQSDEKLEAELVHFVQRLEYTKADGIKILLAHATLVPTNPDTTEFLLDIDAVWDTAPVESKDILDLADRLHSAEKKAFYALITAEARKIFDAA